MNVKDDFLKCNFFILFKWLIIADVQLLEEEDFIILIQLIGEDSENFKNEIFYFI